MYLLFMSRISFNETRIFFPATLHQRVASCSLNEQKFRTSMRIKCSVHGKSSVMAKVWQILKVGYDKYIACILLSKLRNTTFQNQNDTVPLD